MRLSCSPSEARPLGASPLGRRRLLIAALMLTMLLVFDEWLFPGDYSAAVMTRVVRGAYSSRNSGFRAKGLETFGCAERRDIRGVSNNLTIMSLRSRLESTSDTDVCIVFNRTRTQDCVTRSDEFGEASSVQLNGDNFYDSIYNTSLTGCQTRSAFLEMFAADSWLHFEGDSMMRQFWVRLICMIRDSKFSEFGPPEIESSGAISNPKQWTSVSTRRIDPAHPKHVRCTPLILQMIIIPGQRVPGMIFLMTLV